MENLLLSVVGKMPEHHLIMLTRQVKVHSQVRDIVRCRKVQSKPNITGPTRKRIRYIYIPDCPDGTCDRMNFILDIHDADVTRYNHHALFIDQTKLNAMNKYGIINITYSFLVDVFRKKILIKDADPTLDGMGAKVL